MVAASCAPKAPTAEECRALAVPAAVIKRCFGGSLDSGTALSNVECWPYSGPTRLKGLWLLDLERSSFFPNARTMSDIKPSDEGSELGIENDERFWNAHPQQTAAVQGAGTHVYSVELVGRQFLCGDKLEYSIILPPQVLVQRFESMRLVSRGPANFSSQAAAKHVR
jgi:hypothetical protein